MKLIFKKTINKISAVSIFLSIYFNYCFSVNAENENSANPALYSENFNFIKLGELNNDFIYDGRLLLYGGITLIIISIIGIIITLKPRKKRKKKSKTRHMRPEKQNNSGRSNKK